MNNGNSSNNLKGFSLFEILITIGILLIMSALVFPITVQKANRAKLQEYASQLTTDMYYQQQRSALKGIDGGIALKSNGYTIFDGESLLTATETQEENYPGNIYIHSISLSSGTEILFSDGEFKPSTYGSLIISNGTHSARVYINEEGLIEYEML